MTARFRLVGSLHAPRADQPRERIDLELGLEAAAEQREPFLLRCVGQRFAGLRALEARAAELSVLVHETVHHLQHLAGTRFECAQASETLAYAAQEKWLALFGRSLESEFEIDPFTRLVSTRCMQ